MKIPKGRLLPAPRRMATEIGTVLQAVYLGEKARIAT